MSLGLTTLGKLAVVGWAFQPDILPELVIHRVRVDAPDGSFDICLYCLTSLLEPNPDLVKYVFGSDNTKGLET